MDDLEKISRLEYALRSERDRLRKDGGPDNIKGANALNTYLQNADTGSKLRFANTLLSAGTQKARQPIDIGLRVAETK